MTVEKFLIDLSKMLKENGITLEPVFDTQDNKPYIRVNKEGVAEPLMVRALDGDVNNFFRKDLFPKEMLDFFGDVGNIAQSIKRYEFKFTGKAKDDKLYWRYDLNFEKGWWLSKEAHYYLLSLGGD